MLYAKVVVGLPVEGPFDYIVPEHLEKKISVGMRVWVSFGAKKKIVGFVVGLDQKTNIKKIKALSDLIDDFPVLDKKILSLTKKLSEYYCCSWGEAIETALPEGIRKGRRLGAQGQSPSGDSPCADACVDSKFSTILLQGEHLERWDIYIKHLKEALGCGRTAIVLLPDIYSVFVAKEIIQAQINSPVGVVYRKQPQELEEWGKINSGEIKIVVGTRAAVFAPLSKLGLIIIDDEEDSVYKQDQVPHYHAAKVAELRANMEKAKLVLGSAAPSLENIYLARKNKIQYSLLPGSKPSFGIKIIDAKNFTFSRLLTDAIQGVINSKGKALLFLNRKGFATFGFCQNCRLTLKCPRCNINLNYHFKENILNCHYCNFKMPVPKICPHCNAGYIRYSGMGTETIESELSRLFPQAKIKKWDDADSDQCKDADIIVATSAIIRQAKFKFDLIGVLSIDNSLNRIDFRSGEKSFALLSGLLGLAKEAVIIQTGLPHHHSFCALVKNDPDIFYDEELKERKQLGLPPYSHLILVKLRGRKEEQVKNAASLLFEKLNAANKGKGIDIMSVNPAQPPKLRENFYWQILVRSANALKANKLLKINIKDLAHSGIIVTVDVDPH